MNNNLRIVCLIPFLASLLLVQSVRAEILSTGSLGRGLHYELDTLSIIKVGDNASIFLKVITGAYKASVDRIVLLIQGAGISPNQYGIAIILAENIELHLYDSLNKTVSVKPQTEGNITCDLNAWYNWTDDYGNHTDEWAQNTFLIQVKANTFDGLSTSENTFRNLTYILTITTIAFIGTTTYALERKPKQKQTTE